MRAGFAAVLIFFGLTLAYVVWHLWRITPGGWIPKLTVSLTFVFWMGLAFATMGLRNKVSVPVITIIYEVGHPWLIAFLYLLLAFVLADLAVLLRLIPKSALEGNGTTMAVVLGIVGIVMIAGAVHYKHKYREELTIKTEKPISKPLTIVLASDLHLGYNNRKAELSRWVELINAEHPDLVLFGGDVIDIQLRPLLEGHYDHDLSRIEAPVFAVLGNHEYIGDEEAAGQFFADAGITLLRDSVARYQGLSIIGRDDRSNRDRKALSELTGQTDGFTILLDHQPYHLEEAEEYGIDFQFSGHTHRGQIWPVSWLTDAMFEKSWGFHKRGSTSYYISSGLGIWGPKIRIGTRSEYLVLQVIKAD